MKRRRMMQALGAGLLMTQFTKAAAATNPGEDQMIIVTFEVEFETDEIHQKRAAIQAMDTATAQEPGCIAYKTSFDATNPRIMRIYEMWESMAALKPHFQTPHMAAFQGELAGLKPKRMDAQVYEVARELPFPN